MQIEPNYVAQPLPVSLDLGPEVSMRDADYRFAATSRLQHQSAVESNARSYPRRIPLELRRAEGIHVQDSEGRWFIDCLAGAGTLALGHNHPVVLEAVRGLLDGKRPLHTLVPAMVLKDGRPLMAFGVMGAHFQPMGHAYIMTNVFHYGMDPQQAIDAPRAFFDGDTVLVEESVPEPTVAGLKRLGHRVAARRMPWGGAQIVVIDHDRGVLVGASDPRKDGMALGY